MASSAAGGRQTGRRGRGVRLGRHAVLVLGPRGATPVCMHSTGACCPNKSGWVGSASSEQRASLDSRKAKETMASWKRKKRKKMIQKLFFRKNSNCMIEGGAKRGGSV